MLRYALALIAMLVLSANCNLKLEKNVHNELVNILVEAKSLFEEGDKKSLALEFAGYPNIEILDELRNLIVQKSSETVYMKIEEMLRQLSKKDHEVFYKVSLLLDEHLG